jgi:hypothetical protein
MHDKTLEALWEEAPRTTARFDPAMVSELPAPAQRYLLHTFAPGAPLASAARLAMHGELRLKGVWHPFEAEQVLSWDRGFVWRAHAKLKGLPVSGYDRLIDGEGAMRWRFLGIIPFMRADGPDITRSAAGRMHAEAIWFPAVLLGEDVQWLDGDPTHGSVVIRAHGELTQLALDLDEQGALRAVRFARWGEIDTGVYHYETFGGTCEEERSFEGVTIPKRYRLGWFFGSQRFESEGEFIRFEIDELSYRHGD